MTLDYSVGKKVKFNMTEYTQKILIDLPSGFDGTAVTPAVHHLFETNEDALKLYTATTEHFNHVVAQLIFLAKRGRSDLLTAVYFITWKIELTT